MSLKQHPGWWQVTDLGHLALLPQRKPGRKASFPNGFLPIIATVCQCVGPSKPEPTMDASPPNQMTLFKDDCPEDHPIADRVALEKALEKICQAIASSVSATQSWPHPICLVPSFASLHFIIEDSSLLPSLHHPAGLGDSLQV